MRDFRKIVAWQKADDLAVQVYEATKGFPTEERFGLTSQMRRAAVSVAANIAEGSGRQYLKEFLNFLHIARGSLAEVEYYIHLARRLGYLDDNQAELLASACYEAGAVLQGFITAIAQQAASGRAKN
ncbi:MAG: four helix bundle protein [Anaerolineae bacterium]|nr:four helix bundle protein [Anaerolineae bacterium]